MWWFSEHFLPLALWSITRSQSNFDFLGSAWKKSLLDFTQGAKKILLDIIGKSLNWRYVHTLDRIWKGPVQSTTHQIVYYREECCKGFSGASRGTKQEVLSLQNSWNGYLLRLCEVWKFVHKPISDRWT